MTTQDLAAVRELYEAAAADVAYHTSRCHTDISRRLEAACARYEELFPNEPEPTETTHAT